MQNFVQPGRNITVSAPAGGVLSGEGVLVGAVFGVAVTTAAESAPVEISTLGVFDLPKASGEEWALGDKAYWDAANKRATKTLVEGGWIGVAIAPAIASATAARVRLNHQPS